MEKITLRILVVVLLFFLFLLQGCASYKPIAKEDYASLDPLKVVVYYYYPDYEIMVHSATLKGIGMFVGSAGVEIGRYYYEKSLREQIAAAIRPGLNELVMKQFVERAPKEIPNWPEMTFEEKSVHRSYIKNYKSGSLMVFACQGYVQTGNTYFITEVKARIYGSGGKILWAKEFKYNSKDYGRKSHQFKEYQADNYQLLIEEVEFATNTTVSEFIQSLLK